MDLVHVGRRPALVNTREMVIGETEKPLYTRARITVCFNGSVEALHKVDECLAIISTIPLRATGPFATLRHGLRRCLVGFRNRAKCCSSNLAIAAPSFALAVEPRDLLPAFHEKK